MQGEPIPSDPRILPIKEHALSDLLSLHERSQTSATIRSEISTRGLSENFRRVSSMYQVVELVCEMSISLMDGDQKRDVSVLDEPLFEPDKDKLNLIKEFFTADELSQVETELDLTSQIVELVSYDAVADIMSKLGVPLSKDIRIGKKALSAATKRALDEHKRRKLLHNPRAWSDWVCQANPSTRSTTIPNKGEQIHLSTSRPGLAWDLRLWAEWVSVVSFACARVDVIALSLARSLALRSKIEDISRTCRSFPQSLDCCSPFLASPVAFQAAREARGSGREGAARRRLLRSSSRRPPSRRS